MLHTLFDSVEDFARMVHSQIVKPKVLFSSRLFSVGYDLILEKFPL